MKDISISSLKDLLSEKRVGIIGDVMVDRYVHGAVDRISPEAPVPVLRIEREEMRLGGAANVALNILGLGSHPVMTAVVGKDEPGDFIQERMSELGVQTRHMVRSNSRPTTIKSRYIGNHQHIMRMDRESTASLDTDEHDSFMTAVRDMLSSEDLSVLILQDYDKGVFNPQRIRFIIKEAHRYGVPIVVDPKHLHFFDYDGVDVFKPNLRELSQAIGRAVAPVITDLERAVAELRRRMRIRYCMVTLGAHGIFISPEGTPSTLIPAESTAVVDVCGAGDAVVATVSLLFGHALGDGAVGAVCNTVGRIVCGMRGVSPIEWQDLKAELISE